MLLAALLVLVLVPLAGLLVATHRPPPAVASGGELTQRTWSLTRLVANGHEQPLVPGRAPTVFFGRSSGQVDGASGCNSYRGMYTLAGETLHFSRVFFTSVMCAQQELMEQEYAYDEALLRVERYHLEGNTLVLISANGRVQLTFRAG